jgi:Response regulator receiver domain
MIRILVVDDHPVLRAGLEAVLRAEPGFVCVGTAAGTHDAVPLVRRARPDVVVVDRFLAGEDGLTRPPTWTCSSTRSASPRAACRPRPATRPERVPSARERGAQREHAVGAGLQLGARQARGMDRGGEGVDRPARGPLVVRVEEQVVAGPGGPDGDAAG